MVVQVLGEEISFSTSLRPPDRLVSLHNSFNPEGLSMISIETSICIQFGMLPLPIWQTCNNPDGDCCWEGGIQIFHVHIMHGVRNSISMKPVAISPESEPSLVFF